MGLGTEDIKRLKIWRNNEGTINLNKKKSGGQPGNINAVRSGMFVNKCLDEKERILFDKVVNNLINELDIKYTTDLMQVELSGLYFLKALRAVELSEGDSAERLDRMLRMHLKDLKATRIVREESNKNTGNSPAEWISAFMSSYQDKKNAK